MKVSLLGFSLVRLLWVLFLEADGEANGKVKGKWKRL